MTISQLSALSRRRAPWWGVRRWPINGRLICIVHLRVHGRMADPMEIVFDDDLVKTEFNEILLDYLEMQGRLSSDEDASDEDESSSGNDWHWSCDKCQNCGDEGVEPPRHPLHPSRRLPLAVPVVGASTIVWLMPSSQITTLRVEMQVYSGWVNCYQSIF